MSLLIHVSEKCGKLIFVLYQCQKRHLKASMPKWVNSHNIVYGVDSLGFGGFHL